MTCYRKWTPPIPHINTWTISSPTDSLFNYQFSRKTVAGVDMCLIMCKRQFTLTKKKTGKWTKCPALQKRQWWWKSTKVFFWVIRKKTKSTQTAGSIFSERIELVKKTKFVLEIIKFVGWFSDSFDNYVFTIAFWYQILTSASYRCFLKNQ